jgi:hypothetical protein
MMPKLSGYKLRGCDCPKETTDGRGYDDVIVTNAEKRKQCVRRCPSEKKTYRKTTMDVDDDE